MASSSGTITTTTMDPAVSADALPLFVTKHPEDNSQLVLDEQVIVNRTYGDLLLRQNAIKGRIVTSKLFPLIWTTTEGPLFRTLPYLSQITKEDFDNNLSAEEQRLVGVSLRDLVYAHQQGLLPECVVPPDDVKEVIYNVTHVMSPKLDIFDLGCRIRVTPWPTPIHKVMRWIQVKEDILDNDEDADDSTMTLELFLRSKENLFMAFCDVDDLCYHNMENVVNLESMFVDDDQATHPLEVASWEALRVIPDSEVYSFQLKQDNRIHDMFSPLCQWTSFLPPFNADQRGGKRLIFRSQVLADRLTRALQSYMDFAFVNPVFRLNKFEPFDSGFKSHYDLPYCDSIHRQMSKYTLLLYLREGRGESALRVDDFVFSTLESLQGVIFHQSLSHEGKPFSSGSKLFLRSELVFNDALDDSSYDAEVARMFNIACYTSIFQEEIQSYATKLFNHAVACRYNNELITQPKYKLFFRTVDGLSYVTNGHDYWFLASADLKIAAIVVILDYFNGTYQLKRFRKHLEESTPLGDMENREEDIFDYLCARASHSSSAGEQLVEKIGYDCFDDLPPSNCNCRIICRNCESRDCSCPLDRDQFGVHTFNCLARDIRSELLGRSCTIFDGTVRVHLDDIEVTKSDVRFRTTGYKERVFYAGCATAWNCEALNPVDEAEQEAKLFHLPPVKYRTVEERSGYHLTLDMFQNGWVQRTLKIPVFRPRQDLMEEARQGTYEVFETYLLKLSTERDSTNVPETMDR